MAIYITGHDRSGTTLLQRLCNFHPQMMVTNQFTTFYHLPSTYNDYAAHMLRNLWNVKNRYIFHQQYRILGKARYSNLPFTTSFLLRLRLKVGREITAADVQQVMYEMAPRAKIVGDKMTHYNSQLKRLQQFDDLQGIVIYRDCRDVVSSFLQMTRTSWKNSAWVQPLSTAAAVAARWLKWIELMEQFQKHLYLIRYENLVQQPHKELGRLASFLHISADGFQFDMVSPSSVGKHKHTLSKDELAQVIEIAGPKLSAYGYL